jgi:DNA-binding response OmpR family regulator
VPESPLVLIVEDEYLLQADLERALNDGGFATESCSPGEEAIALFMEGNSVYNALLTDVRLGAGLDEVARRIRQKEHSLPVIYVTGPTAEEWASQGVPSSILVSKPFARAQLLGALANLLNIGSPRMTRASVQLGTEPKKTALAVGLTKAAEVRNHPSHHHENPADY